MWKTVVAEPMVLHPVGILHRGTSPSPVGELRHGSFRVGAAHHVAGAVLAELPRSAVGVRTGQGQVAQHTLFSGTRTDASTAWVGTVRAVAPEVVSGNRFLFAERRQVCPRSCRLSVVTPQVLAAVWRPPSPHKPVAVVVHRFSSSWLSDLGHSVEEHQLVVVDPPSPACVDAAQPTSVPAYSKYRRQAVAPWSSFTMSLPGVSVCHHVLPRRCADGSSCRRVVLVGSEAVICYFRVVGMRTPNIRV